MRAAGRFSAAGHFTLCGVRATAAALKEVLPHSKVVREQTHPDKGFLVIRPDSGDPVEAVLEGLEALEKVYGVTVNQKGFKVINNAGIIQGDGINIHVNRPPTPYARPPACACEVLVCGPAGCTPRPACPCVQATPVRITGFVWCSCWPNASHSCPPCATSS